MREVFLHADGGGVLIPGRLACVPRAKPSLRMTMAEATCPSNAETHEGKVNSLSDRFNPTAVLQIGHMPVVLTNHRTSNRGCWPFSSRRLYVKTEHIKKISVPSLMEGDFRPINPHQLLTPEEQRHRDPDREEYR